MERAWHPKPPSTFFHWTAAPSRSPLEGDYTGLDFYP
jgi:hypothetical protein